MKQVKLIALDLDGTLFDSQKQISKENIDAINKATELGIHVVISTIIPALSMLSPQMVQQFMILKQASVSPRIQLIRSCP